MSKVRPQTHNSRSRAAFPIFRIESRAKLIRTRSAAAAFGPAAARSPILRFIPTLIRNRKVSPKPWSDRRPLSTAATFGSSFFPTTKSAMPNHRTIFSSISSRQPMKPRPAWRNGTAQHSRDSGICRTILECPQQTELLNRGKIGFSLAQRILFSVTLNLLADVLQKVILTHSCNVTPPFNSNRY
jgi:hypothetical protein